jgi:hypothetical protein
MKLALGLLIAVGLAGCAESGQTGDSNHEGSSSGPSNVHLYVSNQSFDRPNVRIEIEVDGEPVFDQEAPVGDQHNWIEANLTLAAGEHRLVAMEQDHDVTGEESLELAAGEEHWIVVSYWYGNGDENTQFAITVSDEPVYFG